jgi:hypothetical protein
MQRENLERNFRDTISEKDKQFERIASKSTQDLKDSLKNRTEKLNEKHARELELMRNDRDNNSLQSYKDLEDTKSYYGSQVRDLKRKNTDDLADNDSDWRNVYDTKQEEMQTILSDKNESLQMAGKKLQRRYEGALNNKLAELDGAHQALKDQTADRLNNQVKGLESEVYRLKSNQTSELRKSNSIHDLERENVIMAYEDRMQKLAESKNALVDRTKEVNRSKIQDATDRNERILQEVVTRSKSNQIIANERHKSDRENLEFLHKSELEQVGNKTDKRLSKVMQAANESQKIQEKMRRENLAQLKDNYSNELSNQRQAQLEIMRDSRSDMDEKMKGIQQKYSNKIEETANNYEARLKEVEDKRQKQLNSQAKAFENQLKNRDKQYQTELQSQEMKTELKVDSLQQNHEREIDRLERRHQEQMASLAQKLNYYRKG